MPTPAKGARLGGGAAHERHILANLARGLFEHGSITTTAGKAKRLRPYAERLVTFGKRGDLASRRRAIGILRDKSVVHTLFEEIAPGFADRNGGYTRIVKIAPRKGDNAPMAIIELVEGAQSVKQEVVAEAAKAAEVAAKADDAAAEKKAPAKKAAAKKDDDAAEKKPAAKKAPAKKAAPKKDAADEDAK